MKRILVKSHNQSIIVFDPRAGFSLQTEHSPLYPLLRLPFRICIVHLSSCCLSPGIFFCSESSSRLSFLLQHPSAGSSFLASGPVNFFSSSLSVPALFFLLPLFLAQLHFLFCLFILHAPSFSISTSQMLPVVSVHCDVVSKSLHHTTLHSTQNTSLVSSVVLFPRARRKCNFFLLKASFDIAILCFTS